MVKQIINWTAGSFFRTLGRILLYITIGALIGLFCVKNDIKLPQWLTFIDRVDAATTITPSSWGSKVEYDKVNNNNVNDITTTQSSWLTNDYTNFCTSGYSCYLRNNWYYVVLGTSLDSGKTYTINFSTWITTRASQSYYNKTTYSMIASNTGAYNGSSSANISSFSCRPGIAEGTTTKVDWSCSFTPSTQINYIYIRLHFFEDIPTEFTSYGVNRATLIYDNSQTDAINQQTSIIQNEFTNITNQINENNQLILDGLDSINEVNKVCQFIDKSSIVIDNSYIVSSDGHTISNNSFGITDYIDIQGAKIEVVSQRTGQAYSCFYNINKTLISCFTHNQTLIGPINVPDNAKYFRASIQKSENKPTFNICKNGNQAISDTLTDDNVDSESSDMADFINEFTLSGSTQLSDLLTIPITFIENVLSDSSNADLCTTWRNKSICLPSGALIWNRQDITPFKVFFNLLVGGFLSYKLIISFLFTSERALDPNYNKVEVMKF